MKIYCEKKTYDAKNKNYNLIFDFNNTIDLNKFQERFNFHLEEKNSLFEITNIRLKNSKEIQENHWYDIPLSFFINNFISTNDYSENPATIFSIKPRNEKEIFSFQNNKIKFIQYEYDISDEDTKYSPNQIIDKIKKAYESRYEENEKNEENTPINKLIVKNVGCGNLNEIITDYLKLFYDFGSDIKYSDIEDSDIIDSINFNNKFICILSHWDYDHYKLISKLNDVQISNMKYFIAPTKIPKTESVKKCISKLRQAKIPCLFIKNVKRIKNRINLDLKYKFGNFELYRSSDGSNLNQSGIVIVYKGSHRDVILTGDHHYYQIYDYVISKSNQNNYQMVVPHHGGNAGILKQHLWNNINIKGSLSTKSGRYHNLPTVKNHDYFISQRRFHCTECHGSDYIVSI
ncbi:hypothetical protein A4A28_04105 [Staphylococcus hominis]|nr:hypothetical protein [Staphylococcus hominis]MDO0979284.1 hypothetical protein [Staphylococcus hominis]OIS48410.1 hypothetical protein A4A25_02890 [Staphylococcus hominis]OIS48610.1 hypothetical protein A4A27_01850 [Staphylococcus hominis]OIS51964.1 hypothetical protein A4A28_04105 [Staphylococcus hominis]